MVPFRKKRKSFKISLLGGKMFCQECGNPLKEGDKTCKVCGASVPDAIDTSNSTNEVEFDWNLNGFPEPRKTEDIDFNWNTEDFLQQKEDGAPPMDSLNELNKFLTFDKANQDFQKLLDEQYKKMEDYSYSGKENFDGRQIDLSGVINGGMSETVNIPKKDSSEDINTEEIGGSEAENETRISTHMKGEMSMVIKEPESEEEPEPEVIWITHQTQNEIDQKLDFETKVDEEPVRRIETIEKDADYADTVIKEADDMEMFKQNDHDIETDKKIEAPNETADNDIETDRDAVPKAKDKESALWFEENENKVENSKEGFAVKAILTLIIIILIAEAAILGVQFFLPNSKISDKAAQINSTVSSVLVDMKARVTALFDGEKNPAEETDTDGELDSDPDLSEEQEQGEIPSKDPDPIPIKDKGILIEDLLYLNKNIDKVEFNDSLKWEENRNYSLSSIGDSKPIENNFWYTNEKNEHVYYDSEILATVIKFDSQWQDYVNSGNREVISLTKEDSKARKNVETFSKVGKVEQSFLYLGIGEIRQNKDTFYVWTYEEIKETRGSKTTINKYKWIYCLEPVDNEMKIVNYYRY